MSNPKALAIPTHGTQRLLLLILTFLAATTLALASVATAHAEGDVPEKPGDLLSLSPDAEISAPDQESVSALLDGLNSAHDEKVGVIVTNTDEDAQALAEQAIKEWGMDQDGAIITITIGSQDVGLAVGTDLTSRVTAEDQSDVITKITDGAGEYGDWATGIQSGATRLFLYIEDQGLGDGTDTHDHDGASDGHTHAADDPAVEVLPEGETPDDAHVEEEPTAQAEDSSDESEPSRGAQIAFGIGAAAVAGVGLFFLARSARRRADSSGEESGSGDDADRGED